MEKDIGISRLTHEAYGQKQTIEFVSGSDIHEYMDFVERLLIAASFHPESVKDGFVAKAEEILEEEQLTEERKESESQENDFHTE
jgi:hypothetical protein